ncbi:Protein of unknown function [Cotesia congregata]|uniref:MULE transposase domain-containing protein n=1 Tax=Cotesia congregata TaxID=51543 RepID=A0A8J2EAC9_COTCN|nr:Protein of unknown function [Cotesia congregata]
MANKGEIIEEGGFSYYAEKINGNTKTKQCLLYSKYVCCKKRKSKKCPVRSTKTLDEPIQFTVSSHRHALDFYNDDVRRFRRELIAAAEKNLYPTNEIYATVSKSHLEDVRIQLPYAVISTVMRQHQKEAVDELPELPTYKDFAEFFERNENLCFMRYADKKYVIVSNLENDALLIGDPEFSKSGQCDTIHISSTANILPDFNGTRLLTFILGQDGHYAFPVGIILWTKVARDACTEILNQVKERLFPNVNITKIYVDFDLKLFVEEVFPESDVRGTFNNYCHILFHEALSNNDLRLRIPEHEEFLKKCFSLILLPSNKIKEGFEEISNSLSVETKAQLTNFINYFNRVWIEGVTPTSMSLYEKVESLNTVPSRGYYLKQNANILYAVNDGMLIKMFENYLTIQSERQKFLEIYIIVSTNLLID